MLNKATKINVTGESVIGENVVCAFSALIDVENPDKVIVNNIQRDKEAYKEHRAECRADFAAFEDYVYDVQSKVEKTVIE